MDKEKTKMPKLPLEDIRVLDMGVVWAGPLVSRILADMGARVIRLESIQHPELTMGRTGSGSPDWVLPGYKNAQITQPVYEAGATHHEFNRNKYGITLDISRPRGQEIFKRLIKISDVVCHNFAPGGMERWGLDYEHLKEVNPKIIMFSSSGWGSEGPEAHFKAYGPLTEAMSGLTSFSGYPEPEPAMRSGIDYGDMPAPVLGAGLILAALHYRRKTGKGQKIDVAQRDAVAMLLGDAFVGYSLTGKNPSRVGNRHSAFAPYNLYCCMDGPNSTPHAPAKPQLEPDKHWVAIAVRTDEEWKSLCRAMGNPQWAKNDKFTTSVGRWHNQDEIDPHIEKWTSQRDMYEVMFSLQNAGVPAGGVFDTRDLTNDPQLRARRFWVEVEHPVTGIELWDDMFVKLSKTPGKILRPAPLLGQYNEFVFKELLSMSDKEYEELECEKYIGNKPLTPG